LPDGNLTPPPPPRSPEESQTEKEKASCLWELHQRSTSEGSITPQSPSLTHTNVRGTVSHIAPEALAMCSFQVENDEEGGATSCSVLSVHKASDFWSLGTLMIELFCGVIPYPLHHLSSVMRISKLLAESPETMRTILPANVSDDAVDLIWRLRQLDPNCRLGGAKGGGEAAIWNHRWLKPVERERTFRREQKKELVRITL